MLTVEIRAIRYVSGCVAIGLVVLALVHRRKLSHVEVYLGCYTAILVVWPFTDARFWMPVFPLLLADAWIGLLGRWHKRIQS